MLLLPLVALLQCATSGCGPEAWFSDDDALGFCGWPWFSGNKFSIRLGDGLGITGDDVLLAFAAMLQCTPSSSGSEAWVSANAGLGFCDWLRITGDDVLLAFAAMLQCAPSSSGSEAWVSADAGLGFCDWFRITGKEFFGFSLLPVHKSATRSRGSEAWRKVGDAFRG